MDCFIYSRQRFATAIGAVHAGHELYTYRPTIDCPLLWKYSNSRVESDAHCSGTIFY